MLKAPWLHVLIEAADDTRPLGIWALMAIYSSLIGPKELATAEMELSASGHLTSVVTPSSTMVDRW